MTSAHQWSNSDWIGIFKVGWSSIKDYYTYTWANVPENYTEGAPVDCCVLFHAFYLPRPSSVEYEFVYVDKMGEVCARSRAFTFYAPKPLEELETLKEERDEEDGEEELLLVIPRAQLLQSRLEECLKVQDSLQKALDMSRNELEDEKEKNREAKREWESDRAVMKEDISKLRDSLKHFTDMLEKMEGKHKDVTYSQENLTSELSKLLAEKAESQQKIKDLEDDIKVLTDREKEGNAELERLKDRVKKMTNQMMHEEEMRKSLQLENEAAEVEARSLQARLDVSEHAADGLRRELRELGTRQSHLHTELQQARLQVAQLSLQMSEDNLVLREERANWALEREAYKHAAETDKNKLQELYCELRRKDEWLQEERTEREKLERERDCVRVQQRELQELKTTIRKALKDTDEQQLEKQHLWTRIHDLEPKSQSNEEAASLELTSDNDAVSSSSSPASALLHSSHLERLDESELSTETHIQSKDNPLGEEEEEERHESEAGKDDQLNMPKLLNPVLSENSSSAEW